MSQETLSAVRQMLLGKLAGLASRKFVPFRKIRLNRIKARLDAIERVLRG